MSTSETVRETVAGSDEGAPQHARSLIDRPWRVFVVVLVLAFGNMAVWSLATPFFASPDEPAQVARAVALVHGQLIGQTVKNDGNAITHVTIPKVYAAGSKYGSCFTFKDTVPASCAAPLTQSKKEVRAVTYVGRYPPLYYAIVGLPSLVTSSGNGLYAMRLTSALLNAVFLALAAMSIAAWSRSRFLLVGLLVAVTPMTYFLGGVVNPSGLEITAATCLWCAGLVLALERSDKPPPGLVAVFTVAAIALLLTRALSPLWVVGIVLLLALLAGWRGLRSLARARCVRWALVPLVPAGAFAIGWIVVAHALDLLPVGVKAKGSGTPLAAAILGDTGTWIQQMIGIFGWLDTLSPLLTYLFWYAAIGLFLLLALSCARRRHAGALVLLILIVIFAPVAISYGQAHRLGIIWQARYIMPMAVGVPLMAVALVERSQALRGVRTRVATMVCALLAVAAFAAFAEGLRRYATGVKGPIDYLQGAWQPPFGATALTVAAFVLIALMALFVRQLVAAHPVSDDQRHPGPRQTGDGAPASALSATLPEAGKHVRHDGGRQPVSVGPDNHGSELGV
jgi:Predicted membrane protein (DUF2142)